MLKSIKYLVFYSLILSLVLSIIYSIGLLSHYLRFSLSIVLFSAIFSILYFCLLYYLIQSNVLKKVKELYFLAIVVGFALLVSLLCVYLIESDIISDFLRYHNKAANIVNGEVSLIYVWNNLANVFICRPFVNLVPLYIVFGSDLFMVQLYNVLLHILTGLLLYYFIKNNFKNIVISRLSIIVYYTIPITYVTLNIPSHDIPGLFYLMLSIFLFSKLISSVDAKKHIIYLILLGTILGICMIILQYSRTLGDYIIYSIIVLLFINNVSNYKNFCTKNPRLQLLKKITFVFIIPLIIYFTGFKILPKPDRSILTWIFSTCDCKPQNRAKWRDIHDYRIYIPIVDKSNKVPKALGKLSSEIYYNYYDYIQLLIRKNAELYNIGDHDFWYPEVGKRKKIKNFLEGVKIYSILLRIILFIYVIVGSIYFLKKLKLDNSLLIFFLFWFLLGNTLILIGEVQDRYSFSFHLQLAFLFSVGFVKSHQLFNILKLKTSLAKTFYFQFFHKFRKLIFAIFILFCFTILFGFVYKSFIVYSDLLYKDLSSAKLSVTANDSVNYQNAMIETSKQEKPIKYGLKIPTGLNHIEVSWKFDVKSDHYYSINGFIRRNVNQSEVVYPKLILNDSIIIPNERTFLNEAMLYVHRDNLITYFSSSPLLVDTNYIMLQFVLQAEENIIIDNKQLSDQTTTYLEFLQITEEKPD